MHQNKSLNIWLWGLKHEFFCGLIPLFFPNLNIQSEFLALPSIHFVVVADVFIGLWITEAVTCFANADADWPVCRFLLLPLYLAICFFSPI